MLWQPQGGRFRADPPEGWRPSLGAEELGPPGAIIGDDGDLIIVLNVNNDITINI